MSKVIFDTETTSIKETDGKTKKNDVDILMCTFGEVVIDNGIEDLKLKTLWANGYDDVPNLVQKITDEFSKYRPMKLITFNGRDFDLPVYRRNYMDKGCTGKPFVDADHVDVYKDLIMYQIYFDTKAGSKSLKTLSKQWLGKTYDMNGSMFFKLYDEWLNTGNDEILFDLIEYNQDDVRNTYEMYKRLENIAPKYYLRGKSL